MTAKSRSTLNSKELEFVNKIPYCKFATTGKDGSPHVTPLWMIYEDGRFVMTTRETNVKVQNLRRDSRVAVLVDEGPQYVMVKGRARLAGERDVAKDTEKLAIKALGEEAGPKRAQEIMKIKHVSIEVLPERVVASL